MHWQMEGNKEGTTFVAGHNIHTKFDSAFDVEPYLEFISWIKTRSVWFLNIYEGGDVM